MDLPAELSGAPRADGHQELSGELRPYREAREAFEKAYFRTVLARAGESVAVAAKLAKLHRATLYEKLTRYDIVKQR
jgi:DNA-binding NtrC family response regulator